MSRLLLNDLLQLNDEELARTKVKFNQSFEFADPLVGYQKDPEIINTSWLFWRTKRRYFHPGQIAICLLRLSYDTWLLTTIKHITNELGVTNGINYEGYELEEHAPYYGRLIVKYHKNHMTQVRYIKGIMDSMEVLELLPAMYDGETFPGYDRVCLTFAQLEIIVKRNKRDWVTALENQKAVYLTDRSNGKLYVGSATGENGMLLQRWRNYVHSGHGGNIELTGLIKGIEHAKQYFQFSILENYNARVDMRIILERESWWKEVLYSRVHGYKKN